MKNAKYKKIELERSITRDMSMVGTQIRDKSMVDISKFFGIKWPSILSIYRNGTIESWRPTEIMMEFLPLKMARWMLSETNQKKLILASRRHLAYIQRIKKFKNNFKTGNAKVFILFEKLCELFEKGIVMNISIFWICNWQDFYFQKTGKELFSSSIISQLKIIRSKDDSFDLVHALFEKILHKMSKENYWPENLCYLLTREEIENYYLKSINPDWKLVRERLTGYVNFENKIFPLEILKKRLTKTSYFIQDEKEVRRSVIKGQPAFKGKIRGRVVKIYSHFELNKMTNKAVLVAPMTTPWYLPAMQEASAIVTDEGGIACHAAIVARELRIPCVVGTKIATKILSDGDLVEVDANQGIVKILKRK